MKCIEKDAEYYDQNNPTEMAARIVKETAAIQRAIGEKFGNIVMSIASFFLGYAFAFYWGWKLTLLLLRLALVLEDLLFQRGKVGLVRAEGLQGHELAVADLAALSRATWPDLRSVV